MKLYKETFFYNKSIDVNKLILPVEDGDIEKLAIECIEKYKARVSLTLIEQEVLKELIRLVTECEEMDNSTKIEYPVKIDNNFIQNSHPRLIPNLKSKKYELRIPTYVNVVNLEKGNYFGEVALENKNSKRIGTVLIEEDCDFGVLDKHSYDLCIKELHENIKKANVNFMMSSQMFNFFTKSYFEKHFYNSFKLHDIDRGHKIINEGDHANQIYIIKEGEFNVTFNKSIVELNDLIKYFGGKNSKDQEEQERIAQEVIFSSFMKKKRSFNISIQQPKDIVGLEDLICNNKFAFTVDCKTSKAQYWGITKNVYI